MFWMDDIRKAAKEAEKANNTTRESLLSSSKEKDTTSNTSLGEIYQDGIMVKRADGTLTDYGKMLQGQTEAQQIASTYKPPTNFNADKGLYGGLAPTYEAYVSQNVPGGNQVLSREQWAQNLANSNNKYADTIKASLGSSYQPQLPTTTGSLSGALGSYLGTSGTNLSGGSTNSLLEQQRQSSLNTAKTGLNATRENVLANLSTKKAEIDPRIAQSRASAVSGTTIAQKRLADLIPFSGTMVGAQVQQGEALNTDLQNRQSTLDVEREQSFKDIATQETETERAYQQGLAIADAQAQEQYLSEQLANARTQEERAYAQQQLNDQKAYNAQLTAQEQAYQQQLTAQQQAYQQQQTEEQRTYQEQQTKAQQDREDYLTNIGQFSTNYQKEINNLLAQGVPETDYRVMALRNQRTQKLGAMAEAEQNAYVQAMEDEQAKKEQAFELAKWRFESGLPATRMDSELLGVAVGTKIPAQVIKENELELQRQKESRISTSASAKTAKSPVTLTDYEQALKSTFTDADTAKTQSTKAAEFIIKNRNVLSDEIIQRLATRYNVTEQMINDRMKLSEFGLMKGL